MGSHDTSVWVHMTRAELFTKCQLLPANHELCKMSNMLANTVHSSML